MCVVFSGTCIFDPVHCVAAKASLVIVIILKEVVENKVQSCRHILFAVDVQELTVISFMPCRRVYTSITSRTVAGGTLVNMDLNLRVSQLLIYVFLTGIRTFGPSSTPYN